MELDIPKKKIAFCFIVHQNIILEQRWIDFFKDADPEKYSIYIHYNNYETSHFFDRYKLPITIPNHPAHISLVHIYNYLFREAYLDINNYKFCILSDSCVPFKSFDSIYDFLIKDDKGHFNICQQSQCFPRANRLLHFFNPEKIQKSSSWFILNRKLVQETVFENEYWTNERFDFSFPDEHYHLTMIYIKNLQDQIIETLNLASGATTFINWSDMDYPWVSNNGLKNYSFLSKEEHNYLKQSPCLFGRKFLKNCVFEGE